MLSKRRATPTVILRDASLRAAPQDEEPPFCRALSSCLEEDTPTSSLPDLIRQSRRRLPHASFWITGSSPVMTKVAWSTGGIRTTRFESDSRDAEPLVCEALFSCPEQGAPTSSLPDLIRQSSQHLPHASFWITGSSPVMTKVGWTTGGIRTTRFESDSRDAEPLVCEALFSCPEQGAPTSSLPDSIRQSREHLPHASFWITGSSPVMTKRGRLSKGIRTIRFESDAQGVRALVCRALSSC